jgi:hypothetical protein
VLDALLGWALDPEATGEVQPAASAATATMVRAR